MRSPDWTSPDGAIRLYQGDAMEILPIVSVESIVTDPPFNVGKDYGNGHNDSMDEASFEAWLRQIVTLAHRSASKSMWIVAPVTKLPMMFRLIPDGHLIVIPMKAGYAVRQRFTSKYAGMIATGKIEKCPWDLWEGIRHRGEGYFFRENTYGHPGYTPYPIMDRACRASLAASICDPFLGTGTTGVAAIANGQTFVGVEQNPEYFEIAKARIQKAIADKAEMLPLAS